MGETLIRYLIFFCIVGLIILLAMVARKFPVVGAFFSFLRKLLVFLLMLFLGGVIIISASFLASIVIGMATFLVEENLFVYAGERINPFDATHSTAMIKLSVTYGLLNFFAYIGCTLLVSRFRLPWWSRTTLAGMATAIIIILIYPALIHLLFSDLTVTVKGTLFLLVTILLFVLGHRKKERRKNSYTNRSLLKRIPSLANKRRKPPSSF